MCWVSSIVITRIISLWSSLQEPQHQQSPPKFGWNRGGVTLLSRKPAIFLKWGKIRPRLLLMTNRKLHTRFRLVPKLMTLDDPERLLCTTFHNTCVFRAHHENFNEDRLLLSREADIIIILFYTLSPFHWLQNTWHWITLNGHFTFTFHYYEQRFQKLYFIYLPYSVFIEHFLLYQVTSIDVWKRTVIRRIFGICGRTVDLL